jgi:hypothetical protein
MCQETPSDADVPADDLPICRNNMVGERLLPMTTYFEGKKRFYFDEKGRIYMGNGEDLCSQR